MDQLREVIAAGIQTTDRGDEIEELGFAGGIWSGSKDQNVTIFYWLGAYGAAARIAFPNYCRIRLPSPCAHDSPLREIPVLEAMLIDVINAFDPDVGWVSSSQLWNAIFKDASIGFKEAGWVFYLSDRVTTSAPQTRDFTIRSVQDQGYLITLANAQYVNSSNPDQVAAIRKLAADMASKGVL